MRFKAKMSLPFIEDSPVIWVEVEAVDSDTAADAAFDKAFHDYPQYGGFQIDGLYES